MRPGRRQHFVERRDRRRIERRKSAFGILQFIRCEDASAAAVGQNRQSLAVELRRAGEDFGRGEEIIEGLDAEQSGAAERGVVGRVRTRQGARMRKCGVRAARVAPAFDDDDRFQSCGPTRRRQKLRCVGDGFDVEQNGAARVVCREIIEHVAEVDVRHLAERHHVRKSDVAAGGPVNDRGDQGAGLGNEGQIAGKRRAMREAGVEADVRDH